MMTDARDIAILFQEHRVALDLPITVYDGTTTRYVKEVTVRSGGQLHLILEEFLIN